VGSDCVCAYSAFPVTELRVGELSQNDAGPFRSQKKGPFSRRHGIPWKRCAPLLQVCAGRAIIQAVQAGVPVASLSVPYSVADRRYAESLTTAAEYNIKVWGSTALTNQFGPAAKRKLRMVFFYLLARG
jgi:hypothetical protein